MARNFTNFAESVLADTLLLSENVLYIRSEDVALFPAAGGGDTFTLTLYDRVQAPEIVEVVSTSGNQFTVTRAQEGTAAKEWLAGTLVRVAITAGMMAAGVSFQAADDDLTWLAANLAAVWKDLLNLTSKPAIKAALDLEIGVDLQAWSENLDFVSQYLTQYGLNIISAASYAEMVDLLDVEPGVNVEAWDEDLDWLAANLSAIGKLYAGVAGTPTADKLVYVGAGPAGAVTDLTAFGRQLLAYADLATAANDLELAQRTQTEGIGGLIGTVANGDVPLVLNSPHGGTIKKTTTKSSAGTATFTFKINGVAISGSANAVSTSEQSQTHNDAFVAGDEISITVSSNAACENGNFMIEYTRTLE